MLLGLNLRLLQNEWEDVSKDKSATQREQEKTECK